MSRSHCKKVVWIELAIYFHFKVLIGHNFDWIFWENIFWKWKLVWSRGYKVWMRSVLLVKLCVRRASCGSKMNPKRFGASHIRTVEEQSLPIITGCQDFFALGRNFNLSPLFRRRRRLFQKRRAASLTS